MPTDLVEYFRALTGERSVRAIAGRAGLDQSTLNRQLNGSSTLTIETVVAICRQYSLDLATVFVAVGFLTEDEAKRFSLRFRLAEVPDQDLTREIVSRLDAGVASSALTEPVSEQTVDDVLAERRAQKALRAGDEPAFLGELTESDLDGMAADDRPRRADTPAADEKPDDTPHPD